MTCPRCRSRITPQRRGEPECLNCGTLSVAVAVLEPVRREDSLPPTYRADDGCALHSSCLTCHFADCVQNGLTLSGTMPLFVIGD